MQLSCCLLPILGFVLSVQGQGAPPPGREFIAPGNRDSRSPCPWLNALANHGFLPRDGRLITRELLEIGFEESFNFQRGSLEAPAAAALTTASNSDGSFNLIDTLKHNVALEHDGSLSRNDVFFGDNLLFNQDVWNTVVSAFTGPTVSIDQAARARLDRIAAAQAINPQFVLNGSNAMNSAAETALYLLTLGDRVEGNANIVFLRTIFEQERIPYEEGFVKAATPIVLGDIEAMVGRVLNSPATVAAQLKS